MVEPLLSYKGLHALWNLEFWEFPPRVFHSLYSSYITVALHLISLIMSWAFLLSKKEPTVGVG